MAFKKFTSKTSVFLIFILGFSSCSIKFDEAVNVEGTTPEFIFQGANLVSYENKKIKNEINAERIEQYKNSSESFAKGVSFKSFDDKGELETEGSCGYLSADTKTEVYELYDDINLYNHEQNMSFSADSLKWNSKTEQLIGGKNDLVKIEKEDTVIYGSGFAASGVSKTFSFSGTVSGDIETK